MWQMSEVKGKGDEAYPVNMFAILMNMDVRLRFEVIQETESGCV